MTQEEKKPVPPENAYPELEDDGDLNDAELEELIQAVSEPDTSGSAEKSADGATTAEVAKLKRDAEAVRQQLVEKDEAYMRMYADFDNFRKRTAREKEDIGNRERQKSILEILPIVDNFERAQQAIKVETEREKSIHDSYQSVYRLLVESLKKMGVSRMKTVGEVFDPNLHEAMMQQPSADCPEGTILTEFQPGYMLGETVLRHAMVIVATAAEDETSSPVSETGSPETTAETALSSEDVNSIEEHG
ncbi:MAG: nucleotide exchange factor GrpE [Synechococcus sp.]